MSALEQRVSYVEAKVDEHSRGTGELKDLVVAMDQRIDRRLESLDKKIDARFDALERRFESVDRRFEAQDRRFETLDQKIDTRFDFVIQQASRQFTWLVGIQLTMLIALAGGLLGIIGVMLRR